MNPVKVACLLLFIFWSLPSYAQDLETHVVARADAEDMVSVLAPLAGAEGYVNAYQGKLIIRARPDAYQAMQKVLQGTQDVPQTVTVYVRRQQDLRDQGGGITYRRHRLEGGAGQQIRHTNSTYSLRTLVGKSARISQGNLIAVSGWRRTTLLDLKRGIEVTPRMRGQQVELTIEVRYDEPQGHLSAHTESLSSTLLLTPGQWQSLASIDIENKDSELGTRRLSAYRQLQKLPLSVMVETH